ncbi:MAG: DUF1698 domain-containing protein, partial [Polyangiaceae bacterium]|nr:DUF1698 domain-containing protein [Polyangiaceae bacterium]
MNTPLLQNDLELLGWEHARRELYKSRAIRADWSRLTELSESRLAAHGDWPRFAEIVRSIPEGKSLESEAFNRPAPLAIGSSSRVACWTSTLEKLSPWKKGPFDWRVNSSSAEAALSSLPTLHEATELDTTPALDAEWRCDKKWDRLVSMASSLRGKRILDVGSGNGYYLLRL